MPKNGGMTTGKRGMPERTVPESAMKNPGKSLNPENPGSDSITVGTADSGAIIRTSDILDN